MVRIQPSQGWYTGSNPVRVANTPLIEGDFFIGDIIFFVILAYARICLSEFGAPLLFCFSLCYSPLFCHSEQSEESINHGRLNMDSSVISFPQNDAIQCFSLYLRAA